MLARGVREPSESARGEDVVAGVRGILVASARGVMFVGVERVKGDSFALPPAKMLRRSGNDGVAL